MKVIRAKSKQALLIFFSTLTLTIIITASLPGRFITYSVYKIKIVSQAVYRKVRSIKNSSFKLVTIRSKLSKYLIPKSPWTGPIHERAPPTMSLAP